MSGCCGSPKPSPGSEAAGSGASSARKTVQWTVFSGSSARKTVRWTVFSENGSADPCRWGRQTPVDGAGRPLSMGPAGPWEVALTKNACIVSSRRQAQWACRFRRRRNCHGSNQRFETRHRKTDEVVLLREKGQISDTAGGATSSDPALRPTHLTLAGSLGPSAPLNRSLWSLGKAFGRAVGEFPSL